MAPLYTTSQINYIPSEAKSKYENAVSFIDQIRTDKVKNVELEIFEKIRPETIAKVRAYLQSKGITNISEKKILFK